MIKLIYSGNLYCVSSMTYSETLPVGQQLRWVDCMEIIPRQQV